MAQMERSAKKLPANLQNRNFKAEADAAKTPEERDRLLNLRTAKLAAMERIGDKNAAKYAKGDEKARGQAAAKRAIADAASAGITMSKATRPIIEARAAKAASAAERAGKATAPPAGTARLRQARAARAAAALPTKSAGSSAARRKADPLRSTTLPAGKALTASRQKAADERKAKRRNNASKAVRMVAGIARRVTGG